MYVECQIQIYTEFDGIVVNSKARLESVARALSNSLNEAATYSFHAWKLRSSQVSVK